MTVCRRDLDETVLPGYGGFGERRHSREPVPRSGSRRHIMSRCLVFLEGSDDSRRELAHGAARSIEVGTSFLVTLLSPTVDVAREEDRMTANQAMRPMAASIPAGRYRLDPGASSMRFTAKKLGIFTIRGTMQIEQGEFTIGEPLEQSTLKAVISAASFKTPMAKRDEHVKSAVLLDVASFPIIEFRSETVHQVVSGWEVSGPLTVHGRTREVTLLVNDASVEGDRVRFRAQARVNRHDFGVTRLKVVAGSVIDIAIEVVGCRES